MKYLVLVSHGELATGLRATLDMFGAKGRTDVIAETLADGMDAPTYLTNLKAKLEVIQPASDEIILMGDLQGGSPLTNALSVVNEMGMLERTLVFAGMNLPSAMNALFNKDDAELSELKDIVLEDSDVHQVVLSMDDEEEDV